MLYNHLELMNIQAQVLYVHDPAGRMTAINEYTNQPAPRFYMGHTTIGRVIRFNRNVPDPLVDQIMHILQDDSQIKIADIIRTFDKGKEISSLWMGPAYVFNEIKMDYMGAILVTDDNKACLEAGFPNLLAEIKHREPCYMVIENDIAVSVCFSARYTELAAEAGVETLNNYRGKGYAFRVTSAWAQAIRQSHRIPLYSTSWDNYASQSIAKRLNLTQYGTDVSIY